MLAVLGLGIIASMMGIVNFAHRAFVLLCAYTTYLIHSAGLPAWAAMLAAPVVVAACGFVLERPSRGIAPLHNEKIVILARRPKSWPDESTF